MIAPPQAQFWIRMNRAAIWTGREIKLRKISIRGTPAAAAAASTLRARQAISEEKVHLLLITFEFLSELHPSVTEAPDSTFHGYISSISVNPRFLTKKNHRSKDFGALKW